jgi:transposase
MAPTLHHGLTERGVPVVCIESRQASQALKSLATHKTDRNDARGLAHLARTGFFKPVHVKSLPAHAIRSLIIARKKLVGQRVMLENQIRGLAVVFGVRLPRALSPEFIAQALQASEGIAGLSAAMRGLVTARVAVLSAVASIDADIQKLARASNAWPTVDDDSWRRPSNRAGLHGCRRRSRALQTVSRFGCLSGSGAASLSIR